MDGSLDLVLGRDLMKARKHGIIKIIVVRNHRDNQKQFYSSRSFNSLDNFSTQLAITTVAPATSP